MNHIEINNYLTRLKHKRYYTGTLSIVEPDWMTDIKALIKIIEQLLKDINIATGA